MYILYPLLNCLRYFLNKKPASTGPNHHIYFLKIFFLSGKGGNNLILPRKPESNSKQVESSTDSFLITSIICISKKIDIFLLYEQGEQSFIDYRTKNAC